jgi:hypothetical protein
MTDGKIFYPNGWLMLEESGANLQISPLICLVTGTKARNLIAGGLYQLAVTRGFRASQKLRTQ